MGSYVSPARAPTPTPSPMLSGFPIGHGDGRADGQTNLCGRPTAEVSHCSPPLLKLRVLKGRADLYYGPG